MDTRNYRGEIRAHRKHVAELHVRKSALGVLSGTIWLGEKLTFRRSHGRLYGKTFKVFQSVNGEIRSEKNRLEKLADVAKSVEAREGLLVKCVRCRTSFRTRFGGQLPDKAQWVLGRDHDLARQGWLCHRCWPPAIGRFNDILACYGTFVGLTRQNYFPGYRVVSDGGWITTEGEFDSVEDVKDNLRLVASRRLANACINFWWDEHRDSEVAGYSRNGNPYYQTVVSYSGQARAVGVRAL